jgi:hypothetical protein
MFHPTEYPSEHEKVSDYSTGQIGATSQFILEKNKLDPVRQSPRKRFLRWDKTQ